MTDLRDIQEVKNIKNNLVANWMWGMSKKEKPSDIMHKLTQCTQK